MIKKAMALVLSLALAASTFVAGAAYSDVPADHKNAKAINLMSEMGILQGKDGNAYDPAGTLTRAEACAIIYRMVTGIVDTPTAPATNVGFSDVSNQHWAGKYIKYCVGLGVVDGYPGDVFKPDQAITYAEYITMMVRALGVDTKDFTFPNSYMSIAGAQGMTDGVTLNNDDPAARADVAEVAYNTIFEADYVRAGRVDGDYTTISASVFKLQTANDKKVGANGEITVRGKKVTVDEALIGHNVQVYYSVDSKNEITNYYVVDSKLNSTVTFAAKDIENKGGDEVTVDGKTYSWDNNLKKYYNTNDLAAGQIAIKTGNELISYDLISNDGDTDAYEAIRVTETSYGKITGILDGKQMVVNVEGNSVKIDLTADKVSVYSGAKVGDRVKFVDYSAKQKGNTPVTEAKVEKVEAQTGTITSLKDGVYTVAGSQYEAWAHIIGGANLKVGTEIEYYVVDGLVVEAAPVTETLHYAYVNKVQQIHNSQDMFTQTVARVALEDGTVGNYELVLKDGQTIADFNNINNKKGGLATYKLDETGKKIELTIVDDTNVDVTRYNKNHKIVKAADGDDYIVSDSIVFMVNDDDGNLDQTEVRVLKGEFPDDLSGLQKYFAKTNTKNEVEAAAITNAAYTADIKSAIITDTTTKTYVVEEDIFGNKTTKYTLTLEVAMPDGSTASYTTAAMNETDYNAMLAKTTGKNQIVDIKVVDGVLVDVTASATGYAKVTNYLPENKLFYNGGTRYKLADECEVVEVKYANAGRTEVESVTAADVSILENYNDKAYDLYVVPVMNDAGTKVEALYVWKMAK